MKKQHQLIMVRMGVADESDIQKNGSAIFATFK
jgi:hypothetical protein